MICLRANRNNEAAAAFTSAVQANSDYAAAHFYLGIALYKQGFDFCCYSGDVWVLRDALTQAMKTLREGCKS